MKSIKFAGLTIAGLMAVIQQELALAGGPPPNGIPIPEMDGTGAILAIALLAGLVALIRERFFRK